MSHSSGLPQPGVGVDVVRTGGVRLAADSVSTTTDRQGHWSVTIDAEEPGDAVLSIGVHSPFSSYRVDGQRIPTSTRHGDATVLPAWVVDLHFPYAVELFYRGSNDVRVDGAAVAFDRRSGPIFYVADGTTPQEYRARTDVAGRVVLFDVNAHALTLGSLVGDLVVSLPSPFAPDTVHGVTLTPTYLLSAPININRYGVGPSILYTGELHKRGNDQVAIGAKVTFRRTSGPATDPASFSTVTNGSGRFNFSMRALGAGSVTGDLDVVPLIGTPTTIRNIVLRPHFDDDVPFYGVWAVGPGLPWVVLVQIGGRGVAGVRADFHRTSGIAATPSDFTAVSDANGYLHINPDPQSDGVLEGDLLIHSPPPFASITTHLSLHTVDNDTDGGVIAQFDLDASRAAQSLSPGNAQVTDRKRASAQGVRRDR